MFFLKTEIKIGSASAPLRCYIPDGAPHGLYLNNRPAMIVFPGGSYAQTYEGEAEPIALEYVASGFCAFVLNYSVKPAVFPQALLEALTAIRFVREHVEEYRIDPDRIFVCGFSAGGHLAASVGTLWNHSCLDDLLEGERRLYRPNGLVLSYPVINPLHRGSFVNLLGGEENVTPEKMDFLSLEKRVSEDTPPTFIWHNADDSCVPVESALVFGVALTRNHIPFEMRIWENGGHGCCLGNYVTKEVHKEPLSCNGWVRESVNFLLKH
ncbi:MAG: alpha/beta hydrolase [Clostridia bacterium]|nr:alpha/beta hydrolase [Clostridia bacterium]